MKSGESKILGLKYISDKTGVSFEDGVKYSKGETKVISKIKNYVDKDTSDEFCEKIHKLKAAFGCDVEKLVVYKKK